MSNINRCIHPEVPFYAMEDLNQHMEEFEGTDDTARFIDGPVMAAMKKVNGRVHVILWGLSDPVAYCIKRIKANGERERN